MPGAVAHPPLPAPGLEEERRRIAALVAGASLETAAQRPADIDAYRGQIDAGSDVCPRSVKVVIKSFTST